MAHFRPSFMRELMQLMKIAEQEFHGQVKVIQSDGLDVNTFTVEIVPQRGLYAHASLVFLISVTDQYPNTAPLVTCLTPVFHPNIDMSVTRDNVCLNIFRFWERHFGIKDLIHALLFLLYEPNFDDPYNMYCNNLPMPIEKYIRHTLAGGTVNSVKFPPNEAWCQWAMENGILPLTDEAVQPTPEMDPSKGLTDVNVSTIDEPIENGQPMTSPYFRRSLSGQFTPAATNTNDTDWSNHSSLITRLLPFGFLCHITVQTLNELVDSDIPWSNYNRFYYGESCNADSAEFLWNSVDASVGLDHTDSTESFNGLGSQRSTINSWTSAASEATEALFNSEISGAEELELVLATLLTDAQNEHAVESQHLDAASWNPVGSSCFGGESNAVSHVSDQGNGAHQLQTKDFKSSASPDQCPIESRDPELSGVEMSTSHSEATGNLDLPSKGVTEASDARQNESTESTVLAIVLDQPSTNSLDVQGALDNESTHSSLAVASDVVKASTGGPDCTDELTKDQSRNTPLVGSDAMASNHNEAEQVSELPVHPSSRMELSLEEYNMLPLEIRALLEEPMLDLSLMYPTVDRFGSSIWHVLPHQFHVFKRFLCTLQPCTWPFYQTRWPPFWAPGRGATLTVADRCSFAEDEIRASSAQLRRDLFRYCRHYQLSHPSDSDFSILIVDPLALSPCSPVLNYLMCTFPMRGNPDVVCLRSIRWLSLSESLSLSLRSDMKSVPYRFRLLLLTFGCVLCNFVCYFSRLELYGTSLGFSRRSRCTVIDYLSSVCLVPSTLGCGQCALLDGWPLWLASRAARLVCSLFWTFLPHSKSQAPIQSVSRPRFLFPFSDVDEI